MKKIIVLLLLLFLASCAEMTLAADIVDIFVPDPEPCSEEIQVTIEKATVNGIEVYRISALGIEPRYEFDELSALSEMAAIKADHKFKCWQEKQGVRERERNRIKSGDVKPNWELVK
jgi:hypothetical protein